MLISVIVPVYNAEKYLRECLDSILNQSYRNLELILVDDGSADKSGEICDEYACVDSRVKVIHKENGGVSIARNTGIDASTGELIAFVDSDDYLSDTMLQKLYDKIENNDISVCRFAHEYPDKTVYYQEENLALFTKKPYYFEYIMVDKNNNSYPDRIVCDKIFGSVWRTLFKREIIINNHIRFTKDVKIAEDKLFLLEYCCYCNTAGFVDEYLYHYRKGNSNSATALLSKYQPNMVSTQKMLAQKEFEIINLNDRLNFREKRSLTVYLKFSVCYAITMNEILYNGDNYKGNLKKAFHDDFYGKALKLRDFKYIHMYYNTQIKTFVLFLMIKFRMWGMIKYRIHRKRSKI